MYFYNDTYFLYQGQMWCDKCLIEKVVALTAYQWENGTQHDFRLPIKYSSLTFCWSWNEIWWDCMLEGHLLPVHDMIRPPRSITKYFLQTVDHKTRCMTTSIPLTHCWHSIAVCCKKQQYHSHWFHPVIVKEKLALHARKYCLTYIPLNMFEKLGHFNIRTPTYLGTCSQFIFSTPTWWTKCTYPEMWKFCKDICDDVFPWVAERQDISEYCCHLK